MTKTVNINGLTTLKENIYIYRYTCKCTNEFVTVSCVSTYCSRNVSINQYNVTKSMSINK